MTMKMMNVIIIVIFVVEIIIVVESSDDDGDGDDDVCKLVASVSLNSPAYASVISRLRSERGAQADTTPARAGIDPP